MVLDINLEPRILSDPFTVFVEDDRYGTHGNCNECQQGIAPSKAKCCVHLLPSQGQQCTNERPQDGVCCKGGGGVNGEGVDEVSLDGHKCSEEAQPHHTSTDDRSYPEDMFICCPSIQKHYMTSVRHLRLPGGAD